MSEKTESEVLSLDESDDSESEVIKKKILEKNYYFTNLNDKCKCKTYNK